MKKPTVTQIIGYFNPAVQYMNDQSALDFGKNVHTACRLYDKHILQVNELDPDLLPYLKGWVKFLLDFEPKFSENEKRHENTFYSGGLDRKGIIHAENATHYRKKFILDIKTGGLQKDSVGLQMAAYCNLVDWDIDIAYCINLKGDTGYTLAYYPKSVLKKYYTTFLSMVNTYNFINNRFKFSGFSQV
jgi:hypothetical protein